MEEERERERERRKRMEEGEGKNGVDKKAAMERPREESLLSGKRILVLPPVKERNRL